VKVLAEIPAQAAPAPRAGTLRRRDLEAFDGLLAELGGSHAVLVVGEPARKRTVAVGLAAAAAAAGTRTALVECDLADPTLAEALGLAAAPGLHEYLRDEADAGRILEPLVLAGPGSQAAQEPLVCVVAGRPATDGRLLFASARFRQAATRLRSVYELLVLEGPPVDGGDGTLAALAAEADATLACVGRDDPPPQLVVPLTGLVICD
jgi:Mrp family chromosome partitioning ATPase